MKCDHFVIIQVSSNFLFPGLFADLLVQKVSVSFKLQSSITKIISSISIILIKDNKQIYMIQRGSKLSIQHPNILQQSFEYGLPILWTDKPKKFPKEKSTQINILLKKLTNERMIGTILEETRSRKYSSGKRKANSSLANYDNQKYKLINPQFTSRKDSVQVEPKTFISDYVIQSPGKITSKPRKISISPLRLRLPSLNSPKIKPKEVGKNIWQKISKEGRLKRDLMYNYLKNKTCNHVAQTFIRFLQPPLQSASFKFNQFINNINRISEVCKKFLQFQILDIDNDGIVSAKDILDLYMLITQSDKSPSQQFKRQLDKLSFCLKEYLDMYEKTTQVRTLFDTVVCDRTSTFNKISVLIDRQFKNQGKLQDYVHRSAYRHTFLVFGHNQKIRERTNLIDQARNKMQNMSFRTQKGLSFGVYLQIPISFYNILLNLFTEQQFSMMIQ